MQSVAIRFNQVQSGPIYPRSANLMKEVIDCNPLQSVAIRCNQVQSGPIAHPLLNRGAMVHSWKSSSPQDSNGSGLAVWNG